MKTNVYAEGRAARVPQRNESGAPAPRKTKAPAKAGSAGWLLPTGLILLVVIPLTAGAFRLSELAHGAAITPANARFFASPVPVMVHIVAASVFALLGAFQFATSFRGRRRGWHRWAGRLVVACGLLVGLSGLWMTLFYPRAAGTGDLLYMLRLLFGSAMVVSIVLGFAAIRRSNLIAQGIPPLTFANEADYALAQQGETWELPGLRTALESGADRVPVHRPQGSRAFELKLGFSPRERRMLLDGGLLAHLRMDTLPVKA